MDNDNIKNRIDIELMKIGINNENNIIFNWNFEIFNEIDDFEPMHILIGILERLKRKLNQKMDDIETDEIDNDDNDFL